MKQEGLELGRQLRDDGIARTLGRQGPDWMQRYRLWADEFIIHQQMGRRFTGEDLRAFAMSHGLEEPEHANAWSAAASSFIRAWLKAGTILQDGIGQCTRPESHARIIRAYKKIRPKA